MRNSMKRLVLGLAIAAVSVGLVGCAGGAGGASTGLQGQVLSPGVTNPVGQTIGQLGNFDNVPLIGPKVGELPSSPLVDFVKSKFQEAVNQGAIDTTGANGPAGQAAGIVNGATSIARIGSQFAAKPADQVNKQVVDRVNGDANIQNLVNAVKQEQGR